MRHFLGSWVVLAEPTAAIAGLTGGVFTAASVRALVGAASTAYRLLTTRVSAPVAAVPLAPVTVRTDRHLTAATSADHEPAILANRIPRLPRAWIAEPVPAILRRHLAFLPSGAREGPG